MNYVKWFESDYVHDTLHLSWEQDLAYRRMLGQQYSSERPLPREKKTLYAMVRAMTISQQKAVDAVLRDFFKLTRFGYVNKRAKKEILIYRGICGKRVKAGRQRGKASANAQQKLSKRGHIQNQNQNQTRNPTFSQDSSLRDATGRKAKNGWIDQEKERRKAAHDAARAVFPENH